MTKSQYLTRTACLILTMTALAVTGTPLQANDRPTSRAIEGVWEAVVTIRDCQT